APPHNAPLLRPFDFAFTGVLNVLRLPVTVAPVGFGEHGLPLAVQIASRPGNDHVTISAAQELEAALGGWRPPSRL
ncbi:MAG: amidase, partial [Gemmatimonadetes bacterium]|nr:amidase [Gemmatimonadota bacterium]